jgi:cytochrome b561
MNNSKVVALPLRLLHWSMALLIFSMLAIGLTMVTSLANYNLLVSIHRPLGILILVLALMRLVVRLTKGVPSMPSDMPVWQKGLAHASHWVLYVLILLLPIVGWAMLSAAAYPIILFGSVELPPIAPHNIALFSILRSLHTILAYSLFCVVLVHACAALVHGLIFKDGVLQSMLRGGEEHASVDSANR